jgi:hypothetical protein
VLNKKNGEKMFNLFSKSSLSALLALLLLNTANSTLMASDYCDCDCDPCDSGRLYVGAFGGGIFSNKARLSQMGTAFFTEDEGGPLAVFAKGHSKTTSSGLGGGQIGYEFARRPLNIGCSDWCIAPAAEVEAYYYTHKFKGHLINPTNRLPEHDFADSFRTNNTVIMVNGLITLSNSCLWGFSPYVGGGIGAIHLELKHADSLQVAPVEAGINHFNSRRNDSTWAFAAQARVGLRYDFCESFHVFGEYRYLFVDSSNFILGSTVYPTHAPTSPWNVKVDNINYNAVVFGVQYDL